MTAARRARTLPAVPSPDRAHPHAIVVVGSLNADLVVGVPRFPAPGETLIGEGFEMVPGGKGANQACAAARLGGLVAMVGQVGADAQGAWLLHALSAAGADIDLVATDQAAPSGVALVTRARSGQNTIVVAPGANGRFSPDRLAPALAALRQARVVLLQLEVPLETVVRAAAEARAGGATVLLDPAPARPLPDDLLAMTDFLTPNETELAVLTGRPPEEEAGLDEMSRSAALLLERGAGHVLVTRGARGAVVWSAGSGPREVPAFPVTAVDTTAAGDAFNGALAVAIAEDQSLADGLRFAAAAAALSVTRPGAQTSMPCRPDVTALLGRPLP